MGSHLLLYLPPLVLTEIESALFRNKTPDELNSILASLLLKHLPLNANSSRSEALSMQRRIDHYSHFILRLAFARSEELRTRFSKAETILFQYRLDTDDAMEKAKFISTLGLEWEPLGEEEKREVQKELKDVAGGIKVLENVYYKIDWEKVPDLVARRAVFVRRGLAYVPASLQASVVVAEFTNRLDKALEVCWMLFLRALDGGLLGIMADNVTHNSSQPALYRD